MTLPSPSQDPTLAIYLTLAQYPILNASIRYRMRQELFQRGVISSQVFDGEVREKAIQSQSLEGLRDPLAEEPAEIWEQRLTQIRAHLTDFYFAYNLPYELFEQVVKQTLAERGAAGIEPMISFNPELAPQSMLYEQGLAIESLTNEERKPLEARLREIKSVLIRTLISDQLGYLTVAREWFTIRDLTDIQQHKIGSGKIGGKSAGMLLAARILSEVADDRIRSSLRIPESYYIGADLTYDFMSFNRLMHWLDQKYKPEDQIRSEFPILQKDFLDGKLPGDTLDKLGDLLDKVGTQPLIVRSSSLLEDNFGTSFAGKYESHFCPNQSNPDQNLNALAEAIIRIYASIFNPDALLYRRAKGLQDYDERMAVLIQTVQGEAFGKYFLPHASGVAYSRNLYRWSPLIQREAGFLRLVWGLGTRAVDRTGNDYARMVALSHPTLHPEASVQATHQYAQKFVDVLDLEKNIFTTHLVEDILEGNYPILRFIAEEDEGGYLTPLRSLARDVHPSHLVLTFDELFRRTQTAKIMNAMLGFLEKHYHSPVDMEFTIHLEQPDNADPQVRIYILQCRPQTGLRDNQVALPVNLTDDDIVFSTPRMVPHGYIDSIQYVVFITPEGYYELPTAADRSKLSQAISRLNKALVGENFICVGPGRWGTSNPDLGIHIGYGDIYHTRALVEITGNGIGPMPEASYGTHFFQDLVESEIYPLAIYLDDDSAVFNRQFFYETPNFLHQFFQADDSFPPCLRLIHVASFRPGSHLKLVMDNDKGTAVAFLAKDRML